MLRIWAAACLPILLFMTGCGVVPGYRERFDAARIAQQQAINDADDARCRQYGAKPGSDAYIACRMNAANSQEAADEAQREAWLGVAQTGAAMMATQPPVPLPPSQDHVCIAANNTFYRC
jgi:hypothetical protein